MREAGQLTTAADDAVVGKQELGQIRGAEQHGFISAL
jgi:hypothetical protein